MGLFDFVGDIAKGIGDVFTGGAFSAHDAAGDAADAQVEATQDSNATLLEMYNMSRDDLAPWRDTGENALNTLWEKTQAGPGNFQQSPGYQFAFNEGVNALDRSAAARGRLNSGAQDIALTRYGQGIANQEYDNFLSRYYQSLTPYQSLANVGQTATNTTSTLGNNTATNMAKNQLSAGDARASGYYNKANAIGGGIDTAMGGGIDNALSLGSKLFGLF